MIPLIHDFSEATVLVFGGGPVGARKARRFAREARVVVVSPTFVDESFGGAECVRARADRDGVAGWLDRVEPALVVAATDDHEVNEAIETAAEARRILVNRADRRGSRSAGSVVVPATARDGPVVVAVSTEGRAPALSQALRDRLEESIAGSGRVADVLQAVTRAVRNRFVDPGGEREARRAVAASPVVWQTAGDDGADIEAVALRVAHTAIERERAGEGRPVGPDR